MGRRERDLRNRFVLPEGVRFRNLETAGRPDAAAWPADSSFMEYVHNLLDPGDHVGVDRLAEVDHEAAHPDQGRAPRGRCGARDRAWRRRPGRLEPRRPAAGRRDRDDRRAAGHCRARRRPRAGPRRRRRAPRHRRVEGARARRGARCSSDGRISGASPPRAKRGFDACWIFCVANSSWRWPCAAARESPTSMRRSSHMTVESLRLGGRCVRLSRS